MIIRELLKDWRILLVIVCVLLAVAMVFPWQKSGVVVKSVAADSPLVGKLHPGEILTWANEVDIKTPEDLLQFENFTGTFRFMHKGELDLAEVSEPGLKITVGKQSASKLNLGMDLVGGTRVLLKPVGNVSQELIDQTITTLETRINTYGLRETKFQSIKDVAGNSYIQIEMAGGSREEIDNLLARQGHFEAKIPKVVTLTNDTGSLRIGNSNYTVTVTDNVTVINGQNVALNSTFDLAGIHWQLANATSAGAVVVATVFNGTDIKTVCMVEQQGICRSNVMKAGDIWQFAFDIQVSNEGAQRFADVTKGMRVIVDPGTGDSYLESKIILFLDEKVINDLNIVSDLAGKAMTTATITGARDTQQGSLQERRMLQSVLSSGELPIQLEIARVDAISASLGAEFVRAAMLAALIASAAVMGVIYFRYRRIKILIPMMIWSVSETVLTLGAAAAIGWTLDISSIAGLIAAIGTGTNDQIMMIDEILLGRTGEKSVYTIRQRLKRALFIVFGAAGTIVAAMLPLLFIGIGVMRGFAITTTLGVLIGVFITRPAFGHVAEKILGAEEA